MPREDLNLNSLSRFCNMNAILQTAAGNLENQDRGLVIHDGSRMILCVADGAAGVL
jgi:hypothetical protein